MKIILWAFSETQNKDFYDHFLNSKLLISKITQISLSLRLLKGVKALKCVKVLYLYQAQSVRWIS